MRGGYIFLFHESENESSDETKTKKDDTNDEEAVRCIPMEGSAVDLPPGGRRVFREHAHTAARRGYELAVRVKYNADSHRGGDNDNNDDMKVYTCYIVLDTLNHREAWASAIRMRCDVGSRKETLLRPGGIAGGRLLASAEELYESGANATIASSNTTAGSMMMDRGSRMQQPHLKKGKHRKMGITNSSILSKTSQGTTGNADLDEALKQFSGPKFQQEKWVHKFLQRHAVADLSHECDKLEKWMDVIKSGLRGAVLEQYEYFVEASREMTTMGREVAFLRTLVERQQETLMGMKNIDFSVGLMEAATEEDYRRSGMMENGYDSDDDMRMGGGMMEEGDDDVSTSSSDDEGADNPASASGIRTPMKSNLRNNRRGGGREQRRVSLGGNNNNNLLSPVDEDVHQSPPSPNQQSSCYIEIPAWISDSTEEISSLIKVIMFFGRVIVMSVAYLSI